MKSGRSGFTLVEALVAMTITAMAGGVILLAIESTVQTADQGVESTIAQGMAEQIVDEVLGARYKATSVDPYQYPLGPSSWEKSGIGRERFDDTDDFHGFIADGAEDRYGQPLGQGDDEGGLRYPQARVRDGFFDNWQQRIEVYYVDESNLSVRLPASQTSNLRAVEVTISRQTPDGTLRPLANLRRVYAYVPTP